MLKKSLPIQFRNETETKRDLLTIKKTEQQLKSVMLDTILVLN